LRVVGNLLSHLDLEVQVHIEHRDRSLFTQKDAG
jgi:hypothetical protein